MKGNVIALEIKQKKYNKRKRIYMIICLLALKYLTNLKERKKYVLAEDRFSYDATLSQSRSCITH